jgi:hypothetical protein
MVMSFGKAYPPDPEDIEVSADVIGDKNPQFVDEDSMWNQGTLEGHPWTREIRYRMNKSAAVIGLDVGELKDEEKEATERLFPTYSKALNYARERNLPVIPSVQMVDHKSKVFVDSFYAAIEEFVQQNGEKLGGGKESFFRDLLAGLANADDGTTAHAEALGYVAAGLGLGSRRSPSLTTQAESICQRLRSEFVSKPIKSKPIGFYNRSEELKSIFQQDRFYQTRLSPEAAIAIAKALNRNRDLRAQYEALLELYSHLTNPPSRFSVNDVADYAKYFDDPSEVIAQMLQSEKWKILAKRGAGREWPIPCIQFLPHSTSKENELFARMYNYSAELPQHNIMNRLIRAIRDGEIDLTPSPDSGWYDYQIHAIETLLVPEKGQEGAKLLLTESYKRRLIEAFKTILTKKRELHVKQIELIPTAGMALDLKHLRISPDLDLEPMATYYLRTARGYRFVLNALELILGEESLGRVCLENGALLPTATEEMSRLYYGLYLQVCDNIGMKPRFESDELSDAELEQAKEKAAQWLDEVETDGCYEKDVRYIVPALTNRGQTQVRYWMTVGVRLLKVKADYVKKPTIQILHPKLHSVIQEIPTAEESGIIAGTHVPYKFTPEECFLPVEEFAEATGSAQPLTRDEFRRLCDRCKDKKAVIQAIQSSVAVTHLRLTTVVLVSGVAILALTALLLLFKDKGLRSS